MRAEAGPLADTDKQLEDILKHLEESERGGRALEMAPTDRASVLEAVTHYASEFIAALPRRKAYEEAGYERSGADAGLDLHEGPADISEILAYIRERVDSTGLNPASGGHLGYIPGGGIPEAALGDYLAGVTNRYAGTFYASPGAVRMENAMVQWSGRLVGYGQGFGGNIASGGSMANLIAIATARSVKGIRGKDLERTVVYLSGQAHHSLGKGLRIAGLGECIVRKVAVDGHFRMDAAALKAQLEADASAGLRPFLLIANAGSTDVGAVDPLDALADLSAKHHLWLHVDAAYGGYFLLTGHGKRMMAGIQRADSVVMDPHKGLFLPYGTGIVLVKEVRHLLQAHSYEANYMQDAQEQTLEHSPAELSPELSKHFRGMRMWLPLKLHGIAPFRAALEEKLWLTRYFHLQVVRLGFETTPEPDLSVMAYRYVPASGDADAFNKAMAQAVQQDGRVFISTTQLNGQFWLRLAVLSFRTHRREVDILLEQLERYVQEHGRY